jgi:hypothetical protein
VFENDDALKHAQAQTEAAAQVVSKLLLQRQQQLNQCRSGGWGWASYGARQT